MWSAVVGHGGVAAGGLQRATDEEKCGAYEMKQVANTCEMRIVPRTAKNERGETGRGRHSAAAALQSLFSRRQMCNTARHDAARRP